MTTYHSTIINGSLISVPNKVYDNDGYYVSYNNYDINIYGSDTTAIVIDKSSSFLILNGDHRESLKGLSLNEVCDYFHRNAHLKNKRSNDHQDDFLKCIDGVWMMVRDSN